MDRQIVYSGQIPLETDLLNTNKNAMIGLSKLAAALLGTSPMVNGLACSPTTPPSSQVQIGPGELYSMAAIDANGYSSLAADTTHQILKQGILLDAVALTCAAPTTAGYSINYLVEVAYADTDAGAVVLPYYNAADPTQAYSGPGGSGTAQPTVRKGGCNVQVKAGTAAATGSQTTPAPDAGFVGLWVVTSTSGQTISSVNIARYPNAPIIPSNGLIGAIQSNALTYADDTGAVNAYAVRLAVAPVAYYDGMPVSFSTTYANTSVAPTINVNGLGAVPLTNPGGAPLAVGQITPNAIMNAYYNSAGPRFELAFNGAVGDFRYQISGADGNAANKVQITGNTQLNIAHSGKILDLWSSAPAGTSIALPLTAGNYAPYGFNVTLGPNQFGAALTLGASSAIWVYGPDGSPVLMAGGSLPLPAGLGRAWRIYEFAGSYRIETTGRTLVANAAAYNEAVALGQSITGGTVVNLSGVRGAGVWYTNTSNRPRWVAVGVWLNAYNASAWLSDGVLNVNLCYVTGPYYGATNCTVSGLVMPGHTYAVGLAVSASVSWWTEIV